jgi:hypothetical protein
MRFVIPVLLCTAFFTGAALAQQAGGPTGTGAGTAALSPNNCGTPDTPKACPGTHGASGHHATHKSNVSHTSSQKSQ